MNRKNENPDTLPWKVFFPDIPTGRDKVLAAFRLEDSYRDFIGMCHHATTQDVIKHLVERARRETVGIEVAGAEEDVLQEGDLLPYDELLMAFKEGMMEVEQLKSHEHEYTVPEDRSMSYCRICLRPGDI